MAKWITIMRLHFQWAQESGRFTHCHLYICIALCVCICVPITSKTHFYESLSSIIVFFCVIHRFIQWWPGDISFQLFWWQKKEAIMYVMRENWVSGNTIVQCIHWRLCEIIKWRGKFNRCIEEKKCGYRFSCPLNFHVKY